MTDIKSITIKDFRNEIKKYLNEANEFIDNEIKKIEKNSIKVNKLINEFEIKTLQVHLGDESHELYCTHVSDSKLKYKPLLLKRLYSFLFDVERYVEQDNNVLQIDMYEKIKDYIKNKYDKLNNSLENMNTKKIEQYLHNYYKNIDFESISYYFEKTINTPYNKHGEFDRILEILEIFKRYYKFYLSFLDDDD